MKVGGLPDGSPKSRDRATTARNIDIYSTAIASLGSRFLLFGGASSLTSLCDFMLPSDDKLMRAQPIPF
jgi:hypothetical protein